MARRKHDDRLMELARRGAQAQLGDLVHEIKMLLGLFPHLRDSFDKDELPLAFILKKGAPRATRKAAADTAATPETATPKKKRVLSAAARKAISNAQKTRWALHRAAAKK